ncbi:uncharacterized protein LOC135151587 [Daucus carota subsp. sativus]|uniref:uncharacterized protein LOC135151587 n=1 Tax=Daucus carota subsp. sativus TaxID=79200 RepID=UPI003082E77C
MASLSAEDNEWEWGVHNQFTDTPPSHYVLKLESFSLFSANGVDHITSNSFQVGDHKWKIKLFPKGNNEGKDDHVSLYLLLDSTSKLPAGKGVKAILKFFLLDQIRGNYLVVQGIHVYIFCFNFFHICTMKDVGNNNMMVNSGLLFAGETSRFDRFKCEWGFDKFISLEDFEEPTNGYLVNDTSFFGVEVFICDGLPLGECHSISKVADISGKYKWVVTQFSGLKENHYSDEFIIGGYKWKLWLCPEGNAKYKGHSLSIFLVSVDSESSTTEHEVKAEFELTLNDQFKQNHIKKKGND